LKTQHNLSDLTWKLSGWAPHSWRFLTSMETGATSMAEISTMPASVPGSVQMALLQAGKLPDWNVGLNTRHCEWVENRHWIYETLLPSEWLADGSLYRLTCLGLDYCGVVLLNGKEIGAFSNSFTPHEFDLTGSLNQEANRLQIVFECPPRWLGQFGYTSRMTEWKPRFNYTWDWTPRLVQIGIWDDIVLEVSGGNELQGTLDGGKQGIGKPVDLTHPMMARIQEMLALEDPGRRFMPASSSGPRFLADESDFGKGLHWDVHGPWTPQGAVGDEWSRYWSNDDALFRSEAGSAGASPLDIVERYAGECDTVPGTLDKPSGDGHPGGSTGPAL